MKKNLTLFVLIAFLAPGIAGAALLDVQNIQEYPYITFDSGSFEYSRYPTQQRNGLWLNARDVKIVYSSDPNDVDLLTGPGFQSKMSVSVYFPDYSMMNPEGDVTEWVSQGSVSIKGVTYSSHLVVALLTNFGWGEGAELGEFNFTATRREFESFYGGTFWDLNLFGCPFVYIHAKAELLNGWDGTWRSSFTLGNVTGSTRGILPEPATMLLVGLGLVGLAGIRRKLPN